MVFAMNKSFQWSGVVWNGFEWCGLNPILVSAWTLLLKLKFGPEFGAKLDNNHSDPELRQNLFNNSDTMLIAKMFNL